MAGVRDDDNLVRVSSVSNLAEVCRLLRFDLGSVLAEVLNCADYMLRFDPAIEVRRGAALLLQLIIQGAGSDALEVSNDRVCVCVWGGGRSFAAVRKKSDDEQPVVVVDDVWRKTARIRVRSFCPAT